MPTWRASWWTGFTERYNQGSTQNLVEPFLMRKDAILFGVAGVFFGVLVGWIIGAQQATGTNPAVATPSAPAQTASGSGQQSPPAFDESRASQLKAAADRN